MDYQTFGCGPNWDPRFWRGPNASEPIRQAAERGRIRRQVTEHGIASLKPSGSERRGENLREFMKE